VQNPGRSVSLLLPASPTIGPGLSGGAEVTEDQELIVEFGIRSSPVSVLSHPGKSFHDASGLEIDGAVVVCVMQSLPSQTPESGGKDFGSCGTDVEISGGGASWLGGRLPITGGNRAAEGVALPLIIAGGSLPGDSLLGIDGKPGNVAVVDAAFATSCDVVALDPATSVVPLTCRGNLANLA